MARYPTPKAKAISCLFDQIRELERKLADISKEHEQLKKQINEGK